MCCPPKSEEVKTIRATKESFHRSGSLLSDPQHNANFRPIKRNFIHSFNKHLQGTQYGPGIGLRAETDKVPSLTQLGEREGNQIIP